MYKVRVILDTQEDVIRTFLVDETINLENLHDQITQAFGFEGQEMASFYRADDEWNQGEEIPLFNMAEAGDEVTMKNCILQETMPTVNSKLIYVYDFLNMWTFYVDVVEILDDHKSNTQLILSVGELPNKAPKKEFIAEKFDEDDEINNDFDDFDEFDFNNL